MLCCEGVKELLESLMPIIGAAVLMCLEPSIFCMYGNRTLQDLYLLFLGVHSECEI